MANLIVSTVCPMRCSFCFAGEQRAKTGRGSSAYLSLGEFDHRLAFLDRSGIGEVRLIGGEPTLHPRFPELIARARGRRIVVFTNGLIPQRALACLESLPESECTVLVNMNATRRPDGPGAAETRHRSAVVHRLGGRAKLGFTIFRVDFDLDPLFDLVTESGAQRRIRLGHAQPILGGGNEYLHPKQYPAVGRASWTSRNAARPPESAWNSTAGLCAACSATQISRSCRTSALILAGGVIRSSMWA